MNLLFKIFGGNYDDLWKALIRPNKDVYTKEDLGPIKFEIGDKCYKRTDIELINKRSQKIMCSFWEPFDEERESERLPCVIYLHGNSSSRCEAYQEVSYLLTRNITVFSFDFCGCGQSEGEYISLGYYEKQDVHCIVEYLLKSKKVSKIGLWGRSMGAVTAIMYANEHPSLIDAMVLDSGFYSLKILIEELIGSKIKLPRFIFDKLLKMVKETIREKANFELDIIEPYIYAKNCLVPAFFCHGKDDDFVLPHHSQDLFNEYKGFEKYIELVKGGHNSMRSRKLIIKICNFLQKHLKEGENINEVNDIEKIIENDNNDIDDDDDYDENNENCKYNKKIFNDENLANNILKNSKQIQKIKNDIKLPKENEFLLLSNIKCEDPKKEKSEENASSSTSSNKKENIILYRKKLVRKDLFNMMKIKSNVMSQHFYDYTNKNNNLKLSSILKYINNTETNKGINYQNKKNKMSNSLLNSISIKSPYIKKNNKINQIEKTYTSNFYIKNLNSTNFIQNNFYMTNNSYYKRPISNNNKIKNEVYTYYFSSNKNDDKNIFKVKQNIIYKKKLKRKLLFSDINSTEKK